MADGDTEKVDENSYENTLVISRIAIMDSGVYVCFATNNDGGFNYKSFQLTVGDPLEDHLILVDDNHLLLSLMLGNDVYKICQLP